MSSFTRFDAQLSTSYSLEGSKLLKRDHWLVREAFHFYVGAKEDNCWVYVPAGYLTDGASVPPLFWSLLPPWGRYGQAAVLHDYLCEFLSVTRNGLPVMITRKEADQIFSDAMRVLDVPENTRKILVGAVATYRTVKFINKPSHDPEKRRVEALLAR